MIEVIPEAYKKILLPKQVVHFVGDDWPIDIKNKYYRIKRTQQIPHDRAFIISSGSSYEFDMSDKTKAGLYPDNPKTLYEILVGVKSATGCMLLFPRAPINEYWTALEEGGWTIDTTTNKRKYIGPYSEEETPAHLPQLRYHTVKAMEAIGLQLYNDGPITDKIVLDMVINRCLLEEVSKDALTEKELERAREIIWYGLMAKGGW